MPLARITPSSGAGRRPATGRSFVTIMAIALVATGVATFLGMRSLFHRPVERLDRAKLPPGFAAPPNQ